MMEVMVNTSWILLSRRWAVWLRMPAVCSPATDISMPRKKRMVGMSIFFTICDTRCLASSRMLTLWCP